MQNNNFFIKLKKLYKNLKYNEQKKEAKKPELIQSKEDYIAYSNENEFVEQEVISENEALNILKNLKNYKQNIAQKSSKWLRDVFHANIPNEVRVRRSLKGELNDKIEYYACERFFTDIETKMYFEKNDNQSFYMNIKAQNNEKNIDQAVLKLEKVKGKGHKSRQFSDGAVTIEKIPFDTYRLVLNHDGYDKGDFYFSVNEAGFNEE